MRGQERRFAGWVISVAVGTFLALGMSAPASAATSFGDSTSTPTNPFNPGLSLTNVIAAGGGASGAPVGGVLVSVRVRTGGDAADATIEVLRQTAQTDPDTYTFLTVADIPVSVTANSAFESHVTEVATRQPIAAGDRLGFYYGGPSSNVFATHGDATGQCAYANSLSSPGTSSSYTTVNCNNNLVLLSGTIEPDADGDGYGDETQDQCPTEAAFQVAPCDRTPPETTITTQPRAKSTVKQARIAFTSSEAGSTFECALAGSVFAACTSPDLFNVGIGTHDFQVRATDAAGNVDPSPATAEWKVVKKKHHHHHHGHHHG